MEKLTTAEARELLNAATQRASFEHIESLIKDLQADCKAYGAGMKWSPLHARTFYLLGALEVLELIAADGDNLAAALQQIHTIQPN